MPHFTAETRKNGYTMDENMETGENGQATVNVTWTHTLPRVTAETPKNG
jgi:hypothetical protein